MDKPTIIGIAGGSGSGKTSVTRKIMESLEGHSIVLIEQDYYYKDQSEKTMDRRKIFRRKISWKKDYRQTMIIHSLLITIY